MIYKEKIMNKYICTNCSSECIVHTMDGEPNYCPYEMDKTPSWKDITKRLPEWCCQGVTIYDKVRNDYGIVTDIYGNDCSIRYGNEDVAIHTSYFNDNCTKVWYDWVKVGAYCYDINEDAYAQIIAVNANTCVLNYIGVNWDVVNNITRSDRYFDEMIYEANPVPYGDAQLIKLVGKVLHRNYADGEVVYHLVTDCENHCFDDNMDTYHIKMNGDWWNSDDPKIIVDNLFANGDWGDYNNYKSALETDEEFELRAISEGAVVFPDERVVIYKSPVMEEIIYG